MDQICEICRHSFGAHLGFNATCPSVFKESKEKKNPLQLKTRFELLRKT